MRNNYPFAYDRSMKIFVQWKTFFGTTNLQKSKAIGPIKDLLVRFELPIQNLRGLTCDGASNMVGKKNGVAQ